MSFGLKVLKKYGWSEGDGLGKNGDGIREAIKPKRKTNVLGLGYKLGNEFKDNWWENVFDRAASNIVVDNDEANGSCSVTKLNAEETSVCESSGTKKKEGYTCFLKESEAVYEEKCSNKNVLSDDRLFKKCQGRTAHKGARHGLTLSGKLSRLEKQEQQLTDKRIFDDISHGKVKKKKQKRKEK